MLSKLLSFFLILLIAYYISKNLGNPFAELGATGSLGTGALKALSSRVPKSFLDFLKALPSLKSLSYGESAWNLVLGATLNTLCVVLPTLALSFLLAYFYVSALGKASLPVKALSFVPEYLYAVFFYLTAWYFGWPSPLPGTSNALAYSLVLFLGEFPRMAYSFAEALSEAEWLKEVALFWKAVGLGERQVRAKLLRSLMPELLASFATFVALALERSAFTEPFLGFTGVGYLLFNSVVRADVPLAAASFLALASSSLFMLGIGDALKGRVRG